MGVGVGEGVEGVGREAGEEEGVGREVKGGRLFREGVPLMLVSWMRVRLLPSCMSCVLLCPSLLLLLFCILVLLVDVSKVLWAPSRHLASLSAANWESFRF